MRSVVAAHAVIVKVVRHRGIVGNPQRRPDADEERCDDTDAGREYKHARINGRFLETRRVRR